MVGVARQQSGARRAFAVDTIAYASMAQRNGDNAQARRILATGLATFFPIG